MLSCYSRFACKSVISHQSPITNHQSPITNHQSLIKNPRFTYIGSGG
ncbi:hypothetical protein [Sphaerospermopsis aphanizomenoides]|nr:hypothetical protein [Sphaerospermopsis aphanizomenoides]